MKSTAKKIDLDSGAPLRRALFRVQRAQFLMQMGLISPCVPVGAAVAPITNKSTFIMEEIQKKVRSKCGRELTLDNFYVKTTPDGTKVPRNYCKDCCKEYMREYSVRRREKREAEKLAKPQRRFSQQQCRRRFCSNFSPKYNQEFFLNLSMKGDTEAICRSR